MKILTKKELITITIILLLGLTLVPKISSNSLDITNQDVANQEDYESSVLNIQASSPYDYGFKAGKLLNNLYRSLDIILHFLEKHKIDDGYAKNQIKNLKQYCPWFLEELGGLSASTGIKIDRLIFIQNKLHSLSEHKCTVMLATDKATKNNETFLIFNIDVGVFISRIFHRIFSLKCWVVRISTMEYKYAFFGIPILYEIPFINEEGLGLGSPGTYFTKNKSRYVDEGPGIPTMLLERLAIMICKNVSEVAMLYKNVERANQKSNSWFNIYDGSSSCFCDKEGGILAIEQTHNYIMTVFGNSTEVTGELEGILWHANHHQWLDPNLTGSVYPNEYPSSAFRAERARKLLEEYYGSITIDTCKKIARDHGGGYNENKKDSGDICCHPDEERLIITAFSWIIMPKELTVYWTHSSPCRSLFHRYDFSKIFNK